MKHRMTSTMIMLLALTVCGQAEASRLKPRPKTFFV